MKNASSIHDILMQYWGFKHFRPLQEDVIESILQGHDTLALMPTGGGKSLCYQVPALYMQGLCLVISPLIALMKDQLEGLRKKNITAYAVYSGMSRKEVINTFKVATESNCRFLYLSPERLETSLFKEYLPALGVRLIAVDEAHCISQWGYDFRPPYLRIAEIRNALPRIPVLALTASATPAVQKDICHKLLFDKPAIFRQSFERPNLSYSVFRPESKIKKIEEILENVKGSSIIYCKSRKRVVEIADLLTTKKISAAFYHAGLSHTERVLRQEAWTVNKTRVMVCTNAFGMGIDKPDVRIVIHADIPDCLESYYQEAGRAGRDGKRSYAVLLYNKHDLDELKESSDIKFPPLTTIREVYQGISNYLQVPAGGGEGIYYDFDLFDFLKKFKLHTQTVLFSLKTMEQEGWLTFSESVFLSPTIGFTADRHYLEEFEKQYPQLEPMIKALLRAYAGIFDQPVPVSEKMIARFVKKDMETVQQQLQSLHRGGIIEYRPQKDSPQIYFTRERIKAKDLGLNTANYSKRKKEFELRVKGIIQYADEAGECRSRLIARYFGDEHVRDCGICDNCLNRKRSSINQGEFEYLQQSITNLLTERSRTMNELLKKIPAGKKNKAREVIRFMEGEKRILLGETGLISLKK